MRGLPFFVAYTTSPARVDVLDSFYPDMAAPTSAPSCSADATTWLSNKAAWTRLRRGGRGQMRVRADRRRVLPDGCGPGGRWLDADGRRGLDPVPRPRAGRRLGGAGAAPSDRLRLERNHRTGHPGCRSDRRHSSPRSSVPPEEPSSTRRHARTSPTGAVGHHRSRPRRTPPPSPLTRPWPPATPTGSSSAPWRATARSPPSPRRRSRRVGGSMQTETGGSTARPRSRTAPGGASGLRHVAALSSAGMSFGATHTSGITATSTVSDPGYGAPAVGSAASGSFAVDQIRPELGLDPLTPIVTLDAGTAASMPGGGPCPAANGVAGDGAAGAGWMDTGVASPKTLGRLRADRGLNGQAVPDDRNRAAGSDPGGDATTWSPAARSVARHRTATTSGTVQRPMADDRPVDLLGMDGGRR